MSRVKNISGGPLDVPMLDRQVEAGEVVDVPDFQPAHNPRAEPGDADYLAITWPPDKWEPVAAEKPKPAAKPSAPVAAAAPAAAPVAAPAPPAPVSSDPRERR